MRVHLLSQTPMHVGRGWKRKHLSPQTHYSEEGVNNMPDLPCGNLNHMSPTAIIKFLARVNYLKSFAMEQCNYS